MDEREIEAVARAICRAALNQEEEWRLYTIHAGPAIAALDRVRDARGDDEGHGVLQEDNDTGVLGESQSRSPQDEDHA
jgi:hypothetical protein